MDMMMHVGDDPRMQLLLHLGFLLTAAAFLLRDILWLRVFAIAANLAMAGVAFAAGPEPRWDAFAWNAALVAINLVHSLWLVYERHLIGLTAEERRLYESTFRALDPVAVRKLLRCGEWSSISKGHCLIRQGVHLDRLCLISNGEAAVLLGGRIVSRLSGGSFIGEIGFLSGEPATATVESLSELRCVRWKCEDLRWVLGRNVELRTVLDAAVGRDLSAKIAAHDVKLSQV